MSRRMQADAAFNAAQSGDLDALGRALQPPNNAADQVGYKDEVRGSSHAQGLKPRAWGLGLGLRNCLDEGYYCA